MAGEREGQGYHVRPEDAGSIWGARPSGRSSFKVETDTAEKYRIMARGAHGTEQVDEADTRESADYLVREYGIAFGDGWHVWAEVTRA